MGKAETWFPDPTGGSLVRLSWLFVKREEELETSERHVLERMQQCGAEVASAYALGKRFAQMVRERQHGLLEDWLADATNSGIKVLKGFAKSLQEDIDAVRNALRLPWSQGQVEGQVNRLKLIKRKMFGRCNFDLLRRRVLMQAEQD